MKFIVYLLNDPNFVNWTAFSAFLFSLLSLIWARKSVKISQAALNESTSNNLRVAESEIEQKRLELLKEISNEHEMIQRALVDMGMLKADYDACPELVKNLMGERASIFTNYMPLLENYKSEVEARHTGAITWKSESGVSQFYILLGEQDAAFKNTKFSIDCYAGVVSEFREKLELAQNYRATAQ